jgi:hypothetical protein
MDKLVEEKMKEKQELRYFPEILPGKQLAKLKSF